jgi:MFS family permease
LVNAKNKPIGYGQLIRQNQNFRNLWLGQVISLLGDWFNLIASATLIANLTQSGLAVGGLFVIRMLSQFIMGPIGGVLADRFNRKTILIATDILRALIVLGFLLIRRPEDLWLLYTLTALQLGISGVFVPTKDAILPDIVSNEEIGTANALNATTWSTMLALGAALGGVVAGTWGLNPSFLIDSGSFLLSAVFIARVGYQQPKIENQPAFSPGNVFQEYFDGLRYLLKRRNLLLIALQKASMAIGVSSVYDIIQVKISSEYFIIGEGGSTSLGLMFAAVGIGTGVSPIVARIFTGDDEPRLRNAIGIGYLFAIAGLLIVGTLISLPVVLFGTFVRGFGVAIVWVFSTTLLLQKLPGHIRGRVFGTEYAMFTLFSAVGSATGGWIFDTFPVTIPNVIGGMVGVVCLLGILWYTGGILAPSKKPADNPVSV